VNEPLKRVLAAPVWEVVFVAVITKFLNPAGASGHTLRASMDRLGRAN
jgi:hypothetical protein